MEFPMFDPDTHATDCGDCTPDGCDPCGATSSHDCLCGTSRLLDQITAEDTSDTDTVDVFVYGSLMQGFGNYSLIAEHCQSVRDGHIEDHRLYSLGAFPGARPADGSRVHGELMTLSEPREAVRKLDQLEGHPTFYRRTPITVHTTDGEDVEAWTYVLVNTPRGEHLCDTVTPGEYSWAYHHSRHRAARYRW